MTRVQVLETHVLHASAVIWWLDGTSALTADSMQRITQVLAVDLFDPPSDLQLIHGAGKTAFLRRPTTPLIAGRATQVQRERSAETPFVLAGVAQDPTGHFIPRAFSLTAGNGEAHGLVLYPSPIGARFGVAGGLRGNLRFETTQAPACWALVRLTATTALGATLEFFGQADGNGDFALPLNRLPPLPEGIDHYEASLAVAAPASARPEVPLNHSGLSFSNNIGLQLVPGEIRVIRSPGLDHIAVQPS